MSTKKQETDIFTCDAEECNATELPEDNDFPLGEACDLSGDISCESCQ